MYCCTGLKDAMLLQAVCFMDCFYSAAEGMLTTSHCQQLLCILAVLVKTL